MGLNIPTFIQPDIDLLDNFHSCFLVVYSFSVIDYYYNCHLIGWPVTEVELKEAALHSGVLQVEEDFLEATFRTKCEEIIPYPDQVQPNECKETFLYLKEKFMEQ